MDQDQVAKRSKTIAPRLYESRLQKQAFAEKRRRKLIIFVVVAFAVVGVSAVLIYNKMATDARLLAGQAELNLNPQNKARIMRRNFANGLTSMANDKALYENVVCEAAGNNETDLLITVDNSLTATDCISFAHSDYGRTAYSAGFQRLICRNRKEDTEFREFFNP